MVFETLDIVQRALGFTPNDLSTDLGQVDFGATDLPIHVRSSWTVVSSTPSEEAAFRD